MKTSILILLATAAAALTGCTVQTNADGSSKASLDPEATLQVIKVFATK